MINWIISFLSGRSQSCKINGILSPWLRVNLGIVQGSGIGPTLYIIQESDLKTLSEVNILMKYADDTNLLVPSGTDVILEEEYLNVKRWAEVNKMLLNAAKTKEIVFRRPNLRSSSFDLPRLTGIERIAQSKLLGVVITDNLKFKDHVDLTLRTCSQRLYLLRKLRSQGLLSCQLNTVCIATVISRLTYAISSWGGFCTAADVNRINSFLRRLVKYGYLSTNTDFLTLLKQADHRLFSRMCASEQHCLHQILPALKAETTTYLLRKRSHDFVLPVFRYELYKKSFLLRCLYSVV